jgi:hypothetical protein
MVREEMKLESHLLAYNIEVLAEERREVHDKLRIGIGDLNIVSQLASFGPIEHAA